MTLRLNGDDSGFTEIKAPNAAGDNSITLPTSNGGANQILKNSTTAGELQYASAGGGLHYDSSGRLLVGHPSNLQNQSLQVATTNGGALGLYKYGNNDDGSEMTFHTSRSGTKGVHGIVSDGDYLARVFCRGSSGSAFQRGVEIAARVDGTPSETSMPGRLEIYTTSPGAVTPTARIVVGSNGALRLMAGCPGIDFSATQTNGSATPSSETLDSYEEGTFTPSVNGADNSTGYGQRHGRYTKIGNTVYFNIFISLAEAASSANLIVTGLPFSSGNANDFYNAYGRCWNNQWSSNSDNVQWLHAANASQIGAYAIGNTNVSTINISSMGVNGNFILSGHYKVG